MSSASARRARGRFQPAQLFGQFLQRVRVRNWPPMSGQKNSRLKLPERANRALVFVPVVALQRLECPHGKPRQHRRANHISTDRHAIGVTINARRSLPVTLSYNFSVGRTQAQPAVYCSDFFACDSVDQARLEERRRFGAITIGAVRDRTNSPVDPTRGSLVTLHSPMRRR